jgi:hypothetical protein
MAIFRLGRFMVPRALTLHQEAAGYCDRVGGQNSGRSAGGPPLAIACADFRPGTRNWVRQCRSISFRRFSNAHLRRLRLLRSLLRNRAEQFDHRFHGRRASGAEAMALRDPGRIVIGEPSLAVSIFPDERFERKVDAG